MNLTDVIQPCFNNQVQKTIYLFTHQAIFFQHFFFFFHDLLSKTSFQQLTACSNKILSFYTILKPYQTPSYYYYYQTPSVNLLYILISFTTVCNFPPFVILSFMYSLSVSSKLLTGSLCFSQCTHSLSLFLTSLAGLLKVLAYGVNPCKLLYHKMYDGRYQDIRHKKS